MKLEMEDLIVRYCTRLLDQVAMPKASSYQEGTGLNDPRLQDDLHEAVTLEALRLLDLICQRNASIVTRLFPIVKRFAIDKFNVLYCSPNYKTILLDIFSLVFLFCRFKQLCNLIFI